MAQPVPEISLSLSPAPASLVTYLDLRGRGQIEGSSVWEIASLLAVQVPIDKTFGHVISHGSRKRHSTQIVVQRVTNKRQTCVGTCFCTEILEESCSIRSLTVLQHQYEAHNTISTKCMMIDSSITHHTYHISHISYITHKWGRTNPTREKNCWQFSSSVSQESTQTDN